VTCSGSGTFVRELNNSEASGYVDFGGMGVNGIKTDGGKLGARIRMYHPRFGLCIVQRTVLVGL